MQELKTYASRILFGDDDGAYDLECNRVTFAFSENYVELSPPEYTTSRNWLIKSKAITHYVNPMHLTTLYHYQMYPYMCVPLAPLIRRPFTTNIFCFYIGASGKRQLSGFGVHLVMRERLILIFPFHSSSMTYKGERDDSKVSRFTSTDQTHH